MGQLVRLFALLLGMSLPLAAWASVPTGQVEFVANRGQWHPNVHFAATLSAGRFYAEAAGFTYALFDPRTLPADSGGQRSNPVPGWLRCHAYSVSFVNSQPGSLTGLAPTPTVYNYFLGADSTRWASNVRAFRRLHYPHLYPGTDAYVYENSTGQLEYDFVLQPGARPAAIELRYSGPDRLALSPEGNLLIYTSVGTVTEQAPRAWQELRGQRVPVACAFELQGSSVRFRLGSYDPNVALTIDPTVVFATFTGSLADNWGFTASPDAQGNLYSAGIVFGPGYPASPGAYSQRYTQAADVALIKYNPQARGGAARLYATYLGGSEAEAPHRLVVAATGELVMLGSTSSANFPVSAQAYDRSFAGGPTFAPDAVDYPRGADLFVARLSATGGALQSTFLGGTANDGFMLTEATPGNPARAYGTFRFMGDVALAPDGGILVASAAGAGGFPAVAGYQTTYQGGISDAVVCKISADLRQLVWSTFLGGSADEIAEALQLDATGRIYVAGTTLSPNFPMSPGAYQAPAVGTSDGFVVRLSADGRTLERTCRLGTASFDWASHLLLDPGGAVYVLGQTGGQVPRTPGLFAEDGNVFLYQLNADLTSAGFVTQFGNASGSLTRSFLWPTAFGRDACGRLHIAGLDPVPDIVCTFQLSPDAGALEARGTYGGDHVHGLSRFDAAGTLYQAVCGNCAASSGSSFQVPTGVGYYSLTNNATARNCNDASLKITFPAAPAGALPPVLLCRDAAPLALGGTPAGGTWSGPGVALGAGGRYYFTPTGLSPGTHTARYTPPTGGPSCASATQSQEITVRLPTPIVLSTFPAGPVCVNNSFAVSLRASVSNGVFTGPGVENGLFRPQLAGPGTHLLTYTLNSSTQCGSATFSITVLAAPTVQAGPDTVLCGLPAAPFRLLGASPAGGVWSGRGVSADGTFDAAVVLRLVAGPSYSFLTYTVTGANGCSASATRRVTLVPQVAPVLASLALPACSFEPTLTGLAPLQVYFPQTATGVGIYTWDFGDNTIEPLAQFQVGTTHTYQQPGTYSPVLTVRYGPTCATQTRFSPIVAGQAQVLPNIITPNGDSKNETFIQRFTCESPRLQIFSRWGAMVYETAAYHNDWAGTGLPDGVYYYLLRDQSGRQMKGWLQISR